MKFGVWIDENEDLLTITFTDGKIKEVTPGTSLLEFKNEFQNNFTSKIIAAK